MAKVLGFTTAASTAVSSSSGLTIPLYPHSTGDRVVIFAHARFGGVTTPTGFTLYQTTTADLALYCFEYVAGATPKTSVTLFNGWPSNTNTEAIAISIKQNSGSAAMHAFSARASGGSATIINPAVTTTVDNCLILSCVAGRSGDFGWATPIPNPGVIGCGQSRVDFPMAMSACHTQQPTSGTTSTFEFTPGQHSTGWNPSGLTIAISDDEHGAYVDRANPPSELLHAAGYSFQSGALSNTLTDLTTTGSGVITTINGLATQYRAASGGGGVVVDNVIAIAWGGYTLPSNIEVSAADFASTKNLTNEIIAATVVAIDSSYKDYADPAFLLGFSDGTNARLWALGGDDATPNIRRGRFPTLIQLGAGHEYESYGTFNAASCDKLVVAQNQEATQNRYGLGAVHRLETMTILGGSSNTPASMTDVAAAGSIDTAMLNTVLNQSGQTDGQFYCCHKIQVGNGTAGVYWDSTNQSIEFPTAPSLVAPYRPQAQINSATLGCVLHPGSGGTATLANQVINCGDYHVFEVLSGTVVASAVTVLTPTLTLDGASTSISGVTFSGGTEISYTTLADLSGGNTFIECIDAQQVTVTSEADFAKLANNTFTNCATAIKITGNQTHTGSGWADPGLTVSGNTYDIEYTGTTDFSIQSATALTVNNSSTGTLTVVTPVNQLEITSNIAASDIKIFETGTQTIEAQATGTSATTTTAGTYDITVMKAGYLPQRQTGVVLGASGVTVDITLVADPIYNASHGLTYTTDLSYNRSTKVLTLSTRQDGRDIYSALIDNFIAQSTLDNTDFDFKAIGPDRFDLLAGVTLSNSDNWKGAGFNQYNSSDQLIASYCSIKSSGTVSGTGKYQQVDGSGTTNARASGAFDQIIQYYRNDDGSGTLSGSDYDYEGHLVLEYHINGYYEDRVDVLTELGLTVLEPYEYTVAMEPEAVDITLGDPAITITVVDHTASPLVVGGKSFDYEIQDGGTNSADDILRDWNYNLSQSATYQGKDPFNWPDFVRKVGATYETMQGFVDGQDTTTTLHGCYVSRGGSDHPDFTRFESNDGTYYTPATTLSVKNSSLVSGWHVKIVNETQATTLFNADLTGALSEAFTYGAGQQIEPNDTITYYAMRVSATNYWQPITSTAIATGGDIEFLDVPAVWTEVESWGWDATPVTGDLTEFAADGTNIDIDINDPDGDSKRTKIVAFWAWMLTQSAYIEEFWGGYTVFAANHIRQNKSVVDIVIHNVGTLAVTFSDNDVRYYRDDNSTPYDTTGTAIFMDYTGVPDVIETGVSGLTASESIKLDLISTVDSNVDAILLDTDELQTNQGNWLTATGFATTNPDNTGIAAIQAKTDQLTFTKAGEVDGNTQSMNDHALQGDGSESDKIRTVNAP